MRRLGIAIYPEKTELVDDLNYLKQASDNGFSRLFICLLSARMTKQEVKTKYGKINSRAKQLGFEVTLDVSPAVFEKYQISYDDLSFFKELHADVIRLDEAFDGKTEALMTYNPQNLKVELNMSNDISYLNNILDYKPIVDNLYGCHNFYPQRNSGLEYEYFEKCTTRFKTLGLKTCAFISSMHGVIDPWETQDGLCTLEHHRDLAVTTQAKELWATGVIDDIIIGNAYASIQELEALGKLNRYVLKLKIEQKINLDGDLETLAYGSLHVRRGDISKAFVRSTEVRKKYMSVNVPASPPLISHYGDVTIGNNQSGKYKCELQIALTSEQTEKKNLIGSVIKEELILIKYIEPWTKFMLEKNEDNSFI